MIALIVDAEDHLAIDPKIARLERAPDDPFACLAFLEKALEGRERVGLVHLANQHAGLVRSSRDQPPVGIADEAALDEIVARHNHRRASGEGASDATDLSPRRVGEDRVALGRSVKFEHANRLETIAEPPPNIGAHPAPGKETKGIS